MRNMSFSMTTEAVRRREKTVTRRLGWWNLQPGTILQAVEKAQGLKKGEHVKPICLIRVVSVTRECLRRGIGAVRPSGLVRDIGRAIQDHAETNGFGVVRAFVGHGIGEQFHMDPQVPHYYDAAARYELRPGMVFTIEPMINAGDWRHVVWDDRWTAVTIDGKRSAQFEHTVLVTPTGVEVLTLADGEAQPFAG